MVYACASSPKGNMPVNRSQSQTKRPRWRMQKERVIKEDGRFLIYYRFVPIEEVVVDQPSAEETLPSRQHISSTQESP